MSYGAFVKLEEGIEGLVHISEMSWTRRVNHPSELVKTGDPVEVVVLEFNHAKQEISLGMKQAEMNPWDMVEQHYPIGTVIEGTVRNLTSYGAFVEIEEGIDGLVHISELANFRVKKTEDIVKDGDEIWVKCIGVDDRGKVKMSLRAAQREMKQKQAASEEPRPERSAPPSLDGEATIEVIEE